MRDVPPHTRRKDVLEERRLFVLVIDDATAELNMQALKTTKSAARDFIERLGPNDLAAVLYTLQSSVCSPMAMDATESVLLPSAHSRAGKPDEPRTDRQRPLVPGRVSCVRVHGGRRDAQRAKDRRQNVACAHESNSGGDIPADAHVQQRISGIEHFEPGSLPLLTQRRPNGAKQSGGRDR